MQRALRSFPDPNSQKLWNSSIGDDLPSVKYEALMPESYGDEQAEQCVLHWLDQVVRLVCVLALVV